MTPKSLLAARLKRELEGEVFFDRFTRGRYSTDASIYQIEPVGVAIPKTEADIVRALGIAAAEGVPVVPRGAGTSQAGQAIGQGLVLDTSKHLTHVLEIAPADRLAVVEPGVVLERLNAMLKPHGLWFPVDPATASQATIGGMAGNNSAGARSIRYGLMVDNVRAIDAARRCTSRACWTPRFNATLCVLLIAGPAPDSFSMAACPSPPSSQKSSTSAWGTRSLTS